MKTLILNFSLALELRVPDDFEDVDGAHVKAARLALSDALYNHSKRDVFTPRESGATLSEIVARYQGSSLR